MGPRMDLVAGDTREILLAIGVDDWDGLRDPRRFEGHLALGGGLDPIWLDLFADAVRDATGTLDPGSFASARWPLEGPGDVGDRTIERVDRHWVETIARIPNGCLDHVAGRWIDLIAREERQVDAEEKPMLRSLAGELVAFARRSRDAEDVLFAWSI